MTRKPPQERLPRQRSVVVCNREVQEGRLNMLFPDARRGARRTGTTGDSADPSGGHRRRCDTRRGQGMKDEGGFRAQECTPCMVQEQARVEGNAVLETTLTPTEPVIVVDDAPADAGENSIQAGTKEEVVGHPLDTLSSLTGSLPFRSPQRVRRWSSRRSPPPSPCCSSFNCRFDSAHTLHFVQFP